MPEMTPLSFFFDFELEGSLLSARRQEAEGKRAFTVSSLSYIALKRLWRSMG
jgi:hypothetical protein